MSNAIKQSTTPAAVPPSTMPAIKAVRFTRSISLPSIVLAGTILREADAAMQVSVEGLHVVKGPHHFLVPMSLVEYIQYV